jgi:hypothetical protein
MRTQLERRPAIRTHRGWAIRVLQEAHAILECEYHGWARDRTDPHARDHAVDIARQDPPPGLRTPQWRRSESCWIPSGILAPSARRINRQSFFAGCSRACRCRSQSTQPRARFGAAISRYFSLVQRTSSACECFSKHQIIYRNLAPLEASNLSLRYASSHTIRPSMHSSTRGGSGSGSARC